MFRMVVKYPEIEDEKLDPGDRDLYFARQSKEDILQLRSLLLEKHPKLPVGTRLIVIDEDEEDIQKQFFGEIVIGP
jgi:hypothetical protein